MSKRYPGGVVRQTPATPTQSSASGVWNMTDVTQAQLTNNWPVANVPNPMSRSLRFRSSASAYLNRTPTVSGNRRTWTFSTWIKRGTLGTFAGVFGVGVTSNGGYASVFNCIRFTDANVLSAFEYDINTATTFYRLDTTQVFRDPAAWYHIVFAFDSTQATSSNRWKLYVNGTEVTAFSTATYPSQNYDTLINTAAKQNDIGVVTNVYLDGYMTEVNFIDGQSLDPTSFGQYDQFSNWTSKKYTGTYGTNGFYLPFSNNSSTGTLGNDFSGNSNNWTTNNISLTSGSTYDSMVDVPTQWIPYNTTGDVGATFRGNYCTLNAVLQAGGYTLSDGNLNWARTGATGGGNDRSQFGTIGVTSGKWYWEFTAGTVNSNSIPAFGIAIGSVSTQSWAGSQTGAYIYNSDGTKNISGTNSSYGAAFATGDIIGVAFDADAGTLTFYKNNTSQGQAASGLTSGPYFPAVTRSVGGGGSNGTEIANFGQRPFSYTPPSGFKTLCTTNLSTSTIQQGNLFMNATLYTGNGSSPRAFTGIGFAPNFAWIKSRTTAADHALIDSVRGTGSKALVSNTTSAENGDGLVINSFDSDGYTLATGAFNFSYANTNAANYVSWNWKAGGAAVTNTDGTVSAQVSANTTSGFSVVTYTAPTSGTSATIGHGLGVAPSMIIVKTRAYVLDWFVQHVSLGATNYLQLNTTISSAASSGVWNNTAPTSSVFTIGNGFNNTGTMVAYCFAPVAGYCAIGSYTGNGSADGPFIYTGFRPRFVLVKRTDSTSTWGLIDTARDTYNVTTKLLFPNASDAENTSYTPEDILSNGFKLRDTTYNISSGTYIYMAFAEYPFKSALAR